MWTDLHAHLYDLDEPSLSQVLVRAGEAGVDRILNAATSIATARTVVAQCHGHPSILACVGISPFDVTRLGEDWKKDLAHAVDQGPVVAVGEVGLDNTNPIYPPLAVQFPVFEHQIRCAAKRDIPAVVHSRGAEAHVVDTCRANGLTKVVLHCFTGGLDPLRKALDSGYYVSFSGIVTFSKSALDDRVRFVPVDRLFVETDTPYLSPPPFRGKPNEPARVVQVAEYVGRVKGLTPLALADALERNYSALFGVRPNRSGSR